MDEKKIRIAALSDIHIRDQSNSYQQVFAQISEECDVLVLCGDLTQHGLSSEAHFVAQELTACKIPVIAVLGNHDYDHDQQEEIKNILMQSRVTVLDGDSYEIKGIGFVGTKGFGGGFDHCMLASHGEREAKKFVDEAIKESLCIEKSLSVIQTKRKVVLLHYSPIRETVVGEPPEIFPFLGCSRLMEPIDLYDVDVVFHGHAHHGTHEGKTTKGIPVYNVAYHIMSTLHPDKPYKVIELEA